MLDGDGTAALNDFDTASKLDPKSAQAHIGIAQLSRRAHTNGGTSPSKSAQCVQRRD